MYLVPTSTCFASCPADIILEIVLRVLPNTSETKQRSIALTSLRLVCKGWNDVVTSAPRFWSSFFIFIPSQVIPTPIIQLWLERSREASIDIHIQDGPPASWNHQEIRFRENVLSIFQPQIWRCKSLYLEVSVGLTPGLRKLRLAGAHRLERFGINMRGSTDEDLHQVLLRDISSLASMRHLNWMSSSFPFMKWLLHLTEPVFLEQLTSITLACPVTTHELIALMQRCTSAERLVISWRARDPEIEFPIESPASPTFLPKLRSLDISLSPRAFKALIHHTLPINLKILRISGPDISDLPDTLSGWAPSLGYLKTVVWKPRDIFDQVMAFLCHPNILPIPILEIESRESDRWSESGGWNELDDEQRFRPAAEDFNRAHAGSRVIRYDRQSGVFGRFFVGWFDPGLVDVESFPPFPLDEKFVDRLLGEQNASE